LLFSSVISERGPRAHTTFRSRLSGKLPIISLSLYLSHSPFSCSKMRNVQLSFAPMEIAPLFFIATWWDQINGSTRWQSAVFFFLCAAYALVASIALVHSFSSSPSSTVILLLLHRTSNDYVIVAAFVLFSSAPLLILQVQLVRIEVRVPEYGWTTQKIFHLMNFVVNGGHVTILARFTLDMT